MTELEGKLSTWIQSGSFNHANDIFVVVMLDENEVGRTDAKDGFTPEWDSTFAKHIKGSFEKVILKLVDEDTASRDDSIATMELATVDLLDDGINGERELLNNDGEPVGTMSVNINFEEGDINLFSDLADAMLHKSES